MRKRKLSKLGKELTKIWQTHPLADAFRTAKWRKRAYGAVYKVIKERK